ncbi:FecR family protein [Aeoliella mucimassa]|uniref:Uncharacterized protein n=1 Tax=Aeoliella mucimassa TaxID=2527972 RepID=A0A518AJL4_9BACT|nr:hypothetical protein [Aeoliella mucimassa]QDU54876.1 hypothetical protein Pan181_10600 [Aeoliella mucimassa]
MLALRPLQCLAVLLIGILTTPILRAQDAVPAAAEATLEKPAPELPTIAEEPKTIDPAKFLPELLRRKATVDFSDSSLREVVEWLRSEQGFVVLVEQEALSNVGYLPGDPYSDQLNDEPIYLLLNRLRKHDMAWFYEDEILHITSAEVASEHVTTQPYNIREHLDAGYDTDPLIDTVISTVASDSWVENGGPVGAINLIGDVLFVRQCDKEHLQLQALLEALLHNGRRTIIAEPLQHETLREKLKQEVSVKFRDTPLEEAVAELATETEADIRLEASALEGLRIRLRQPVTITIDKRPLATVLQAMLLDLKLTYVIQDGVIWITSQEEAGRVLKTAVFDVRDLCRDNSEADALIEAIISQTSDVWVENGRQDADLRPALPGTLVVYATEPILDEVLHLLETYRTALRSSKPRAETQPVDMNEVITVYYRLDAPMAESLNIHLPFMVAPDSWKRQSDDAPGTISLIVSKAEKVAVSSGQSPPSQQWVPKSVLVITQTRAVHEEISEVIRRVELGDNQGGFGSKSGGMGGGGFGGGFFAVPENHVP